MGHDSRELISCGCSVAKSCLTLCDPMVCMLGFPVLHHLSEFSQTHVQWVSGCHPTISSSVTSFSSCLLSFPTSGSFPMSWLFASVDQSIRASALASILPVNIQGLFPLGLTGLISLQFKGFSRVFSNTTVQEHQFFSIQLCYGPVLTTIHDYWKNNSFGFQGHKLR